MAVDDEGRPSFQALHHQSAHTVVYYAFDILQIAGRDLTREPLDRAGSCSRPPPRAPRFWSRSRCQARPRKSSKRCVSSASRAMVAKRRSSRYEAGRRSGAWLKVKFSRRQEFVVGGYKPANAGFDSVLVGYYDRGRLHYAGKVRAGFTPHARAEMMRRLAPIERRTCPFVNLPSVRTSHWGEGVTAEDMAALKWVKPAVVVEVAFTEWTRDGNLRHAAYVGLREDKPAREVRRET